MYYGRKSGPYRADQWVQWLGWPYYLICWHWTWLWIVSKSDPNLIVPCFPFFLQELLQTCSCEDEYHGKLLGQLHHLGLCSQLLPWQLGEALDQQYQQFDQMEDLMTKMLSSPHEPNLKVRVNPGAFWTRDRTNLQRWHSYYPKHLRPM